MADETRRLTFEQREGLAPLPQQLRLKELPKSIRAPLWAVVYDSMIAAEGHVRSPWSAILRPYWVGHLYRDADMFPSYGPHVVKWVKPIILDGSYAEALGFLEHAIQHFNVIAPKNFFALQINRCLEAGGAAYRVLDGSTICPISSPEEAQAVQTALDELGGYAGARTHLHSAASLLTACRYADSVRESIHAVESVARVLAPDARTLDPALSELEKRGHLHPAMKKGFSNLYGYTNDEKGVRHALLDAADSNVSESDALYMFVACAAFAAYLHRRSEAA